jgi:hypothetical protein
MFPKQIRPVDEKVLQKVRGMGCCVCGQHPVDASHIRSRGAGGPDTMWNVVPHCRRHHTEWHSRGWKDFMRRNPSMAIILARLGWSWVDDLWHPLLNPVEGVKQEYPTERVEEAKPVSQEAFEEKFKIRNKTKKPVTSSL